MPTNRRGRPPAPAERGELATLVARYRRALGLTQAAVAVAAGVSRSFISQLEAGRYRTAEPPTLQRIAEALQAPVQEILEAAGLRPPDPAAPRATPLPPPPPDPEWQELADLWPTLGTRDRAIILAVARAVRANDAPRN